jgi:hypothetical protein
MSKHPKLTYYSPAENKSSRTLEGDIAIYCANSGGVIAAIAARRHGLKVILLEPGRHLGGLTAGGLGYTDIGNKHAIGGLSREFYRRVGRKYGKPEFWTFEPHVAEEVYAEWLAEEGIECHFGSFLDEVRMDQGRIVSISTENGFTVTAKMFIDASYEGDLMAKANVSYTVGRESNALYGETWNGAQVLPKHQFELFVDPYVEEGNPASGLLPGIESGEVVTGEGDHRIQAYNFRLCLTDNPSNRIPFSKPENYRREDYELLARYCRAGYVPSFTKFDRLIHDKVDMNNHGAVSTDFIGMNYRYPEASYAEREEIFQAHVRWIKGLMWFWHSDPDVPAEFQDKVRNWGWCADEFAETGGFPHAMYVREARRLVGDVVMTEHHCMGTTRAEDSVALAAYTMDSHNCRRVVIDGAVKNEGDVQVHSGPPYPISYRSIIPKKGECKNLAIPFCLSASHIAFGSIRMEPVFMILSESAAEACVLALEKQAALQEVPYGELRDRLLRCGQVLDSVPDVKNRQSGE